MPAVGRAHLIGARRAHFCVCCLGIEDIGAFLDIELSCCCPVYGHAKQGASFGHAKMRQTGACCARACHR